MPTRKRVTSGDSLSKSLLVLVLLFFFAFSMLVLVSRLLPQWPLSIQERLPLTLKEYLHPNRQQLIALRDLFSHFISASSSKLVLVLFCGSYVLLQTFAIPGPVVLSVLAGAIFGRMSGFLIVTACTVIGSCTCRIMYSAIGKPIVNRILQGRAGVFSRLLKEVREKARSGDLLFYFVFLRLTPILPNWFINVSAGPLGVPMSIFIIGTLVGVLPNNIIMVGVGAELGDSVMSSGNDEIFTFSPKRFMTLIVLGLVSLIPIILRRMSSKYNRID